MTVPTLVVSDPPHGEVDLDAAAALLGLDVFAARLKSVFPAPEIMEAAGPEEARRFAAALGSTGFRTAVVDGAVLSEVPWSHPVETLVLDATHLEATSPHERVSIPYDADILGVVCGPPGDGKTKTPVSLRPMAMTEEGPVVGAAVVVKSSIDLYAREGRTLRRVTVVPDLLELDADRVLRDLGRRCRSLQVDRRLAGVRPRAPFGMGAPSREGPERRRYSFGTEMLADVLESIAPTLRDASQYEIGSRLAYALSPL